MVKKIVREVLISEKRQLKKRMLKKNALKNVLKKTGLHIIHKQLHKDKLYKKHLENLKNLENLKKLERQITKFYDTVLQKIKVEEDNNLVDMFKKL